MKHTNHYSNYLKLKEQADGIETLSVKARVMAQANRELRKHQIINRTITNSYWTKLEAKYATIEISEELQEDVIVEDKETIMELQNVDGKLNLLEIIEDKPKRGRIKKVKDV